MCINWIAKSNVNFVQRGASLQSCTRFQQGVSGQGLGLEIWQLTGSGQAIGLNVNSMVVDLNEAQLRALEQMRQVLAGPQA